MQIIIGSNWNIMKNGISGSRKVCCLHLLSRICHSAGRNVFIWQPLPSDSAIFFMVILQWLSMCTGIGAWPCLSIIRLFQYKFLLESSVLGCIGSMRSEPQSDSLLSNPTSHPFSFHSNIIVYSLSLPHYCLLLLLPFRGVTSNKLLHSSVSSSASQREPNWHTA